VFFDKAGVVPLEALHLTNFLAMEMAAGPSGGCGHIMRAKLDSLSRCSSACECQDSKPEVALQNDSPLPILNLMDAPKAGKSRSKVADVWRNDIAAETANSDQLE
jgi:hypothetical protein